jgi:TATA-binding protein-associated factor
MAWVMIKSIMIEVLKLGVPMLGDITYVEVRKGVGMLVISLVNGLGPELIAYAPLLIMPLLGCMNVFNFFVCQSVTNSFVALVPLFPLAHRVPTPRGLNECQASKSVEDIRFLD